MAERLDKLLVDRGFATSRAQALEMISAGQVRIRAAGHWQVQRKPSVRLESAVEIDAEPTPQMRYVSRAGLKLEMALSRLVEEGLLDAPLSRCAAGRSVLDIGQSTGGFTDCVLQHGAALVVGVDVGRDQLASALRQDDRVVCHEAVNARRLPVETLLADAPDGFDWVVMDVSFISQTLIVSELPPLIRDGGYVISLVKPQFELTPADLGKGGLVRNEALFPQVRQRVQDCMQANGLKPLLWFESGITGADGNREFFLVAQNTNAVRSICFQEEISCPF